MSHDERWCAHHPRPEGQMGQQACQDGAVHRTSLAQVTRTRPRPDLQGHQSMNLATRAYALYFCHINRLSYSGLRVRSCL